LKLTLLRDKGNKECISFTGSTWPAEPALWQLARAPPQLASALAAWPARHVAPASPGPGMPTWCTSPQQPPGSRALRTPCPSRRGTPYRCQGAQGTATRFVRPGERAIHGEHAVGSRHQGRTDEARGRGGAKGGARRCNLRSSAVALYRCHVVLRLERPLGLLRHRLGLRVAASHRHRCCSERHDPRRPSAGGASRRPHPPRAARAGAAGSGPGFVRVIGARQCRAGGPPRSLYNSTMRVGERDVRAAVLQRSSACVNTWLPSAWLPRQPHAAR
jgi:hypothetical protein